MNKTELREKSLRIAHEARAKMDTITSANETEVMSEVDRMLAESDALEARAAKIEAIEARESALNVADPRRPTEDRSVGTLSPEDRHAAAFDAFLRNSETPEQRAELRAQSKGTASEGGHLVPTLMGDEIVKTMALWGPMLDPALVRIINTTTGADLNHPTFDNTSNKATKVNENAQVSDENLAFGVKALPVYKYKSGIIKVPSELMTDSAFDVGALVSESIAEAFGRGVNEALTIGDGTGDPNGIVTACSTGVTAASVSAIATDELLDLIYSVNRAYHPGATFQFNTNVLKALRKLKDGENRYIWMPGMTSAEPGTLLGFNYRVNDAVPNMGANNESVIFGAHKRYAVRVVGGIVVKRLEERYADYDQTAFVAFGRYGGNLLDAAAVKALSHPAS
jgi:HK97 family phage major capsid protein